MQYRDLTDQRPGQTEDRSAWTADPEDPGLGQIHRDRDVRVYESLGLEARLAAEVVRRRLANRDQRLLRPSPEPENQEIDIQTRSPP